MSRPKPPVSDKQLREIVALGQKQAESGFPNPKRVDCPNPSMLRAMAYRDKRFNPAELPVSHVALCSPCFREYTRQRRNAKMARAFQVAGGSVIVGAILLTAAFLARNYFVPSELPSISQQPAITPPPRGPTEIPSPAPMAMKINLAPFSPTRSSSSAPRNHIRLPAKLIRAKLLMPIGSEPGEYSVRLLKPNDEVLLDKRIIAAMQDGITSLEVDLRLETLGKTRLTLMIQPPGLSWRTYPLIVE